MDVIFNKYIPFKGFKAINLFGVVFAREGVLINQRVLNHEYIHSLQCREMLFVFFYVWYAVEYIVRLVQVLRLGECETAKECFHTAYHLVSFEVEAFNNQNFIGYPKRRRKYAWLKFIKQ